MEKKVGNMSRLSVLSWNVYVKHKPLAVRQELSSMIRADNPDVICLYECKHLYGRLTGFGYEVLQLKPKARHKGHVSNNGNIAILVRKEQLTLLARFAMFMHILWRGPHLGAAQDPRVYRWIRVKKDKTVWKVGGFHFPFGTSARQETLNQINYWFDHTPPGRPTVAVGDFNLNKIEVKRSIADKVGAQVAGSGIDLVVYNDCALVSEKDLGHHGSDHPAKLYVLTD